MDAELIGRVTFRDYGPVTEDFETAVLDGLSAVPKTLPCKFLYDKTGSELFDRICALEEYYPTRTEIGLLRRHGPEVAELMGDACHVIEFGSGSSVKIRLLLDALDQPAAYTAIDISREHLLDAAASLARAYPDIDIEAVCADYTRPLALPPERNGNRVGFFPGSTIGNFAPDEARAFLHRCAEVVGRGGEMLIGVDLKKDERLLLAAYNDREGITAAFNENLLVRINRELDGNFDLAAFSHDARYNKREGRIEMHLVSHGAQTVRVGERSFAFRDGETIHTESSYKFSIEEFRALSRSAGFDPVFVWTDPSRLFSLHYLRAV